MAAGETVLLYNFETHPKLGTLKVIFLRMGIRVRVIKPQMYLEPVGALVPIKGIKTTGEVYTGSAFEEEMLVMYGFSNARLDQLLRQLHKERIPRIRLKAVITVHNASWNSLQLHEELLKEDLSMHPPRPEDLR